MSKVSMTTKVAVSAAQIWDLIGGFNALPEWHPAVEKSVLEEGGTVRRLSLAGGGEIVERLEQSDDDGRVYTYSILESPLPVAGYVATIKVRESADGGSEIEWSSEFSPSGAPEAEAVQAIQGIYQAGFDSLKKMFGG